MTMVDVTQLYCPSSGGPEGGDNTTHHLVPHYPRGGGRAGQRELACRYCGMSERELREAAQG